MADDWVELGELAAQLARSLSESELQDYQRLTHAIDHALRVASDLPTTFDSCARVLIIQKLQEAGHWSFELLRVAEHSRRLL